jgi:RNAse (barnase) inhibitor barstar
MCRLTPQQQDKLWDDLTADMDEPLTVEVA